MGWLNFLIWFLPNQSLKKSVELGIKKGFVDFKSDKYEGVAREINPILAFFIRYSFVFIMVLLLFPKITWNNWTFWISITLAAIVAGITILHVLFRHRVKFIFLCYLWLILVGLFGLYYYFHPTNSSLMFFMFTTIRNALFWYFIFLSVFDFYALKKRRFFSIFEKRILFYV